MQHINVEFFTLGLIYDLLIIRVQNKNTFSCKVDFIITVYYPKYTCTFIVSHNM